MPTITAERVATLIQRELASIINVLIENQHIGYINITEVRLTKDKSISTIYYSILNDTAETKALCQKELLTHLPQIRAELAKKLKNLRRQPDLVFKFDEALAYGNMINAKLNEIAKKDQNKG